MRWPLLSLALIVGIAYSQQHGQDKKEPSKREQTGTEKKPFIVKITPSPKTAAETKQEEEERNAKRRAEEFKQKTDADLAIFTEKVADYTKALFVVGAIQAAFICFQLLFIWRQEASTRTIERAYVKMSHNFPGLVRESALGPFSINMKVENFGNTPSETTDLVLQLFCTDKDELLPDIPHYAPENKNKPPLRAFLVAGEHFNYTVGKAFSVPVEVLEKVRIGERKLYLIGYVDYIDKFKRRHRAGYARLFEYHAATDANNLIFVTQKGYNYDRQRKKGEGSDWDEKIPS